VADKHGMLPLHYALQDRAAPTKVREGSGGLFHNWSWNYGKLPL